MTSTWPVLRLSGLPHRNRVDVAESGRLDVSTLATALRVNDIEIEARRYVSAGGGRRIVNGVAIGHGLIEARVRRFSPNAIFNGLIYHPATHELRALPFSTIGWDMLRTTCPCTPEGTQQGWTRTHGTASCDSCGKSLSRVEPVLVPEDMRAVLGLIVGLVDQDVEARRSAIASLPPELHRTGTSVIFENLRMLAESMSAHVAGEGAVAAALRRTGALALACEAMLQWPRGLTGIAPAADIPVSRWDAARRDYLSLDFPVDIDDGPSIGATGKTRHEHSPAIITDQGSGPISAMAAARLGAVDETALKQAWDHGRFTQHRRVQGGERVRAFDPEEVMVVAPTLRRHIAMSRMAAALGVPLFGAEQLVATRVVVPDASDPRRRQATAYLDAVALLTKDLKKKALDEVDEPITLLNAIRHVSGRPKPYAPIFSTLLEGSIDFAFINDIGNRPLTSSIVVSTSAVEKIATLSFDRADHPHFEFASHWTQADALECLNGYKNSRGPLAGLKSIGGRVRHFAWTEVEDRARDGVTTSDLARRFGLQVANAYAVLDKSTCRGRTAQIAPGLWERVSAERELRISSHSLATGWLFDVSKHACGPEGQLVCVVGTQAPAGNAHQSSSLKDH